MSYPMFDRSRLHLKPLAERIHDMKLAEVLPLDAPAPAFDDPALPAIAERIVRARQIGAPVILLMGAHVIKVGLSRFVIDLMERGIITHVGMNGAGPIHDFELALIGATTESVARYIQEGQFGLWDETGWINDIVAEGVRDGLGYGEALGRAIQEPGGRDQGSGDRGQGTGDRMSQLPASSLSRTPTPASSPPAIGCACRSPCTSASARTSSTSTRTATARRWARRRTATS